MTPLSQKQYHHILLRLHQNPVTNSPERPHQIAPKMKKNLLLLRSSCAMREEPDLEVSHFETQTAQTTI
jgi:hypothetical protein